MNPTEITITVVVVSIVLLGILVIGAYYKVKNGNHHKHIDLHVFSEETVVPETGRRGSFGEDGRRKSISSPDLTRAQKFRERAKSVSLGRPAFKVSVKKGSRDQIDYESIYGASEPNEEKVLNGDEQQQEKYRQRLSFDKTEHTDIEANHSDHGDGHADANHIGDIQFSSAAVEDPANSSLRLSDSSGPRQALQFQDRNSMDV